MKKIINTTLKLNLWNNFDIQFAYMISNNQKQTYIHNTALMIASACLSSAINNGHTYLPLKSLLPNKLFQGCHYPLAYYAWKLIGCPSIKNWEEILLSSSSVSDGSYITPIILQNKKLYTLRMWQYENIVAKFFYCMNQHIQEKEKEIIHVLNIIFPKNDYLKIDWQKIAVTIAITNKITLIFGGPGTGKTFTITKLLTSLVLLNKQNTLNIKIAATTGKAARQLNKAIITATLETKLTNKQKQHICQPVTTLHKLLKIKPDNKNSLFKNNNNKLNADIIIIDEASMIDLSIMAHLIKIIPQNARVIFIGDHHQLSSIDSGFIIQDLYKLTKKEKYSKNKIQEIFRLTGYKLPYNKNNNKQNISDNSCVLRKNYRFNKNSGINNLAVAVNKGKKNVLQILNSNLYKDISYFNLKTEINYQKMIKKCASGYLNYLKKIKIKCSPEKIIKTFNKYKILCVMREGIFGVIKLNNIIETILNKKLLIKNNNKNNYVGRPIIITKNDPSLHLFNGDTGILLPDNKKKLHAYFFLNEDKIKKIPIPCLPEHETNFVMTVHKSQGSEFEQVSLILPNKKTSILTRELLYTAITRTRLKFNIYAIPKIISYAISNKTQKNSDLINKIKNGKKLY